MSTLHERIKRHFQITRQFKITCCYYGSSKTVAHIRYCDTGQCETLEIYR
jgi:hypothetical protein